MSQKFHSSVQRRQDLSFVKLGGVIDEDNQLAELVAQIPDGTAVIDLGDIERINSCGVRDWVTWLSRLEGNGTRAVLIECSPAIVAQINLVSNFTGNGVVKSFYVPYFCPECDEEKLLLVEASDMGPPPHEPPTCRCDECDLMMDFDDMADSYFAFLGSHRILVETDRIDGALRELGRGGDAGRGSQPSLVSTGAGMTRHGKKLRSRQSPGASGTGPRDPKETASLRAPKSSRQPPLRSAFMAQPPHGRSGTSGGTPARRTPSEHSGPNGVSDSVPRSHGVSQGFRLTQPTVSPLPAPSRSNAAVIAVIAGLIIAISILAYLVATS